MKLFSRKLSIKQIESLYNSKKYQEIIDKVNFENNTDYKIIQMIAHSNFELKNHEIAFKQFRKALALEPEPYLKNEIRMNIAFCYYNIGEFKNSISYIQEIESDYITDQIKYGDYRIPKVLGDCFLEIGKYEIALESFKKVPLNKKEITPELKEVLYSVASAYELLENNKQALKFYNKVFSVDINYLDTDEKIEEIKQKIN